MFCDPQWCSICTQSINVVCLCIRSRRVKAARFAAVRLKAQSPLWSTLSTRRPAGLPLLVSKGPAEQKQLETTRKRMIGWRISLLLWAGWPSVRWDGHLVFVKVCLTIPLQGSCYVFNWVLGFTGWASCFSGVSAASSTATTGPPAEVFQLTSCSGSGSYTQGKWMLCAKSKTPPAYLKGLKEQILFSLPVISGFVWLLIFWKVTVIRNKILLSLMVQTKVLNRKWLIFDQVCLCVAISLPGKREMQKSTGCFCSSVHIIWLWPVVESWMFCELEILLSWLIGLCLPFCFKLKQSL